MRTAPSLLLLAAALSGACSGSSSGSRGPTVQSGLVPVVVTSTDLTPAKLPVTGGPYLPLVLRESVALADLNMDGDMVDEVVHVYDSTTDTLTNLEFATQAELVPSEEFVAFLRDEASEALDLNMDGDQLDQVLFVHDLASGTTRSTMFAVDAVHAIAGRAFFSVPEAENGGLDLNSNGNTTDRLLWEHNPATGFTVDTGYLYPGDTYDWRGDTVVFVAPDELRIYDVLTGNRRRIQIVARDLTSSDNCLAFSVLETDEGMDLNNDGDLADSIVFIYDYPTAFLRNTRIPRDESVPFAFSSEFVGFVGFRGPQRGVVLVDILDVVAEFVPVQPKELVGVGRHFLLIESEDGIATDRNGDGDTDDEAATYLDIRGLVTKNLELAVSDTLVRDGVAFLSVEESAQGLQDLSGDGDAADSVLFRLDGEAGFAENTQIAAGVLGTLGDRFLVLGVFESLEPLNGDGDTDDVVLHVLDLQTNRIQNLELAVDGDSMLNELSTTTVFPLLISEAAQGADLDGDGDMLDTVLHVLQPQS